MYEKIVIVAFKHLLFLIKTILYLFWYIILGTRLKGWIIIVKPKSKSKVSRLWTLADNKIKRATHQTPTHP